MLYLKIKFRQKLNFFVSNSTYSLIMKTVPIRRNLTGNANGNGNVCRTERFLLISTVIRVRRQRKLRIKLG